MPQNIVTWTLVLVLDALGLLLAYKSGNKKPYLQLGWVIASFLMFFAVMFNGSPFYWGTPEKVSVALCAIAIFLWLTRSAQTGLVMYAVAVFISFIPLMGDYWSNPQIETLWLWILSIVPGVFAFLGAEKKDFANTFIPWCSMGLNMIFVILCL
ncbi:MAG: hypothetical protein WC887_03185, partial [Candidatus Paceibacterota bacterium]